MRINWNDVQFRIALVVILTFIHSGGLGVWGFGGLGDLVNLLEVVE